MIAYPPTALDVDAPTVEQRAADRDVMAAALLRYAAHDRGCPADDPARGVATSACTCGLAPLARRAAAPRRFGTP